MSTVATGDRSCAPSWLRFLRIVGVAALGFALVLWPPARAGAATGQDPAPDPLTSETTGTAPVDPWVSQGEPSPEGGGSPGVPGDTAETTTTEVAVVGPASGSEATSPTEKANERVRLVVISLVALAVVVSGATVVFWRRTNPSRAVSSGGGRMTGSPGGS